MLYAILYSNFEACAGCQYFQEKENNLNQRCLPLEVFVSSKQASRP